MPAEADRAFVNALVEGDGAALCRYAGSERYLLPAHALLALRDEVAGFAGAERVGGGHVGPTFSAPATRGDVKKQSVFTFRAMPRRWVGLISVKFEFAIRSDVNRPAFQR